jgi:hypothetical protein
MLLSSYLSIGILQLGSNMHAIILRYAREPYKHFVKVLI